MNNPEYVKIGNKKYKINTDFRIGLECDAIGRDENIGQYERSLAIIYKLFGDEGLCDKENHNKLLELGMKYLSCGKEIETTKEEDMSFQEDIDYIEASFMSDYHIELSNTKMHWWTFYKLLNGLSNSEIGNCCVLNRVRNLRNFDESKIQDSKERQKIHKAKQEVSLKKNKIKLTKEQEKSMEKLNKILGL